MTDLAEQLQKTIPVPGVLKKKRKRKGRKLPSWQAKQLWVAGTVAALLQKTILHTHTKHLLSS